MNTHAQMLEVITAHRDGKSLQCRPNGEVLDRWADFMWPLFDFVRFEYRIKPDPVKAREFFAALASDGRPGIHGCLGLLYGELPRNVPSNSSERIIHVREVLPPTAEGE